MSEAGGRTQIAAAAPRARAVGWLAGGLALALFLGTTSRYVASHDPAEFQTLAATGGIAHAGYPALVMVLEAFGRLPFSTLPFRANLVSVVAGALVVGLAAWSGVRVSGRAGAGLLAGLGLALSLTFWKESTHAGVHGLSLAIGVVAFQLARRFAVRPTAPGAWLLGLLGGLGMVSHLTILALAPVVAWSVAQASRRGGLRPRHLALAIAGLLVGLSPFLYLLGHDRPEQPMNYIHDTLRPDNAVELSGGHPPIGRVARAAWLLSARQYLGGFVFSPFDDAPRRLRDLALGGLLNEFPLWGWPLGLYGAWVLARRRDPFAPFLGLWLTGALLCVLYGARHGMEPIFFLPGLWVASQLVAAALGDLGSRSRLALAVAGALLVVTPLARIAIAEPPGPIASAGALRGLWRMAPADWNPFRADTTWAAYGRGVMTAVAPRAVVLSCWEEATTLRFVRFGERLRDDVDVLYHCRMPRPAFAAADSAGRPIYTTYPPTLEMTGGRAFLEVGRWARGGLWRIAGAAPPLAPPG